MARTTTALPRRGSRARFAATTVARPTLSVSSRAARAHKCYAIKRKNALFQDPASFCRAARRNRLCTAKRPFLLNICNTKTDVHDTHAAYMTLSWQSRTRPLSCAQRGIRHNTHSRTHTEIKTQNTRQGATRHTGTPHARATHPTSTHEQHSVKSTKTFTVTKITVVRPSLT